MLAFSKKAVLKKVSEQVIKSNVCLSKPSTGTLYDDPGSVLIPSTTRYSPIYQVEPSYME